MKSNNLIFSNKIPRMTKIFKYQCSFKNCLKSLIELLNISLVGLIIFLNENIFVLFLAKGDWKLLSKGLPPTDGN